MNLTKPLNCIDVEATGLAIERDRILSLAILQLHPGGETLACEWMFNPGLPIPPDSTAIHGIRDEDVKDCPPFADRVDEIYKVLQGVDATGYNILGFDLPILWEELYRCGIEWDVQTVNFIDTCVIFKKKEPRDLAAAVRKFCGREHDGAHNAMEDTKAARDVLLAMGGFYSDLRDMTTRQLADMSKSEDRPRVDLCGTIVLKDGVPVFNTKRNKDVPVTSDRGYAEWFLRNDFPQSTKLAIRKILDGQPNDNQGRMF